MVAVRACASAGRCHPSGAHATIFRNVNRNQNYSLLLSNPARLAALPAPARRWTWLLLLAAVLLCVALLSLALGAKPIPLLTVIDAVAGYRDGADAVLVRQGRVPRTLLGLVAGAALGAAGALIQALTRNPLADAGLLGVNAGASFAVVAGIALFGASAPPALLTLAFTGALAAAALVYGIGRSAGPGDPARFVLAGLALGAVLTGLSSALTLFDAAAFDRFRYWNAGTLDVRDSARVAWAALPVAAGLLLALLLAPALNLLALGDGMAATLGLRPLRVQALGLLAATLLCGAATAAAGPIGFVGLMVPLLARRLAGAEQRWIVIYSTLFGALLLLLADIAGRLLVAGELRVSVVTAFVGAPVLIALARRLGAA